MNTTRCGALCVGILWAATLPLQQDAARQKYEATISRVRVDVIVTDGDGRFVDGLEADDFVVYEDGQRQQILEVQLVAPEGGSRRDDESGAPADTGIPDATGPVALEGQGAVVFVIDGLHTSRRMRSRFAREWAVHEQLAGPSAVPRAAYLIDYLGKMRELAPLSRDPEAMHVAAERAFGKPISSETVDEEFARLRRTMLLGSPLDPKTKASRTYAALTALCNALATLPGRKALVWVSAGQPVVEGASHGNRFGGLTPDRRITKLQRAFHQAANTAGVSVYGLDPGLVIWRRYGGAASSRRGPVDAILRDALGPTLLRGVDAARGSLLQTARATGGKAFLYARDIRKALQDIEEEASRYYLLTYATPEPLGDGMYHEIQVQVRDRELNVKARAGYLDLSVGARHQRAVAANMRFSLALSELTVVAKAYRRWDPIGRAVVQVAATATDAEGRPDDNWDWFHAVAFDEDGRAVDQAHLPVGAGDAIGRAAVPAPEEWPLQYVHDLALPPGTYDITVALADEPGNRVGATDLIVEVPKESSWQTSDLILALRPRADSPLSRPLLDGRIGPGEIVVVYVEVRGGDEPVLIGNVRGPEASAEPVPLPPVSLPADRAGIHRGALEVRLDRLGACVVHISVIDAAAGERKELEAELEVVAPEPKGVR